MEKSLKIVQFEQIAKYAAVKHELNYMKDENSSYPFFFLFKRKKFLWYSIWYGKAFILYDLRQPRVKNLI